MLVDGWKREFSIRDFADPMTETNREAYWKMVAFAKESIAWCRRERLVPVFVLPPLDWDGAKDRLRAIVAIPPPGTGVGYGIILRNEGTTG